MFKGKITIKKNINGKEEIIEKEFDSEKEYFDFVKKQGIGFDSDSLFPDIRLSLPEWGSLGRFIDSVFEEKIATLLPQTQKEDDTKDLPVDINKYEQEARKIEEEKQKKKEKEEKIKKAIDKLKGYLKTFEKEGNKKLSESVKKDIEKLQKELKELKK